MCGTAAWEWDPEQGGSKFAYEAVCVDCQGCYVKGTIALDPNERAGRTVELLPTQGREAAKRHVANKRKYLNRGES